MLFYTAPINIAGTTGDSVIIAAANNPVHVYIIGFTADANTYVTLKHGSTAFSGGNFMTSGGVFQWDYVGIPRYVVGPGETFVISQSGTANIGGQVWYTKG